MAAQFPSKWLQKGYCDPEKGGREYLNEEFSDWVVKEQVDQLETKLLQMTQNCTTILPDPEDL